MNKIFMAVFGLLFFIANICSAYAPAGKLYVTMLDVGQGDAFLVETPSQNVLIDTGDVDRSDELVAELKNAGFTRFEQIILTHPHADHIGGVNSILGNFTVDTISDNGIVATSPLYLQYHTAEVKINTLKTGDVVDLGGGVKFKVLYPSASFVSDVNRGKRKVNYNDTSIVGKLIFGDFSVLFTGDAGKFVEDTLRENFQADLKSTILKAGHHGAKTSSTSSYSSASKRKALTKHRNYKRGNEFVTRFFYFKQVQCARQAKVNSPLAEKAQSPDKVNASLLASVVFSVSVEEEPAAVPCHSKA